MNVAEFLRLFPLRAPSLMWFLGAGASAASGIATAADMIWDFKRRLYCTEQRISICACEDLSNPVVRAKMQRYLDNRGDCPPDASNEEYSHYFSTVFPNEADRRRYIDQMIAKAAPSFGFIALAVLIKRSQVRVLWTTNFDRNVEDGVARVVGTTARLTVSSLDTPNLMREAFEEARWPILAKLHGDFQSRRLKNTSEELQTQDAELRCQLVTGCKRFGLIVTGYSGRDESVMNSLEEGIDGGKGYPSGLFWFSRGQPNERVSSFIQRAAAAGIDAHLIELETFDEFLADIVAQFPELPKEDADLLNDQGKRLTDAPLPRGKGGWPVIRLNALEIVKFPSVCRVLKCDIGGAREVDEAIEAAGARLVAARRKVGVLFFGGDAEAEKAFKRHGISSFDVHAIEPRRLWYDSVEAGLVYDGLVQALARERGLIPTKRRGQRLLHIDALAEKSEGYAPLRTAITTICGIVPGTSIPWAEAIEIHLAYRLNRLWLVMEPTVWTGKPDGSEQTVVREFQRERQARRYNKQASDLLTAWCMLITAKQAIVTLSAFGARDGIDATFQIGDTTAFSRRFIQR